MHDVDALRGEVRDADDLRRARGARRRRRGRRRTSAARPRARSAAPRAWRAARRSSASGLVKTVRSGSLPASTSACIERSISVGSAKMPMLATASASVATAKNVRDRRRLRSVIDLRESAETMPAASGATTSAVADRDDPVRPARQLEVVRHVEDRLALVVQPLEQLEHLRRGDACRGCRSARRRRSASGRTRAPARSRPAAARRPRAPPAGGRALSPSPTSSRLCRARSKRSRFEPRRAKSSGSTAFSSADSVGSSWKNWKTMPTCSPRQTASSSSLIVVDPPAVDRHRARPSAGRSR